MTTMEQRVTDHDADLIGWSTATFNAERTHRYLLTRQWGTGQPAVFCMLNPSTADAFVLDPTIRRCVGFAKREGCGALRVVNLFGLRATKPGVLRTAADPVGPSNDWHISEAVENAAVVVVAWGAHGDLHGRAGQVARLLDGTDLYCLGVTQSGAPRHPLYIAGNTPLQRWTPGMEGAS